MMTPGDQLEFIGPNFHGPYTKLVRHISAVNELLSLVPTNDPSLVDNPTNGLTARERRLVANHIDQCMEMICTFEKHMMNSVLIIDVAKKAD